MVSYSTIRKIYHLLYIGSEILDFRLVILKDMNHLLLLIQLMELVIMN
nr:MAG TPA: hypothetical protein [Caudoviricetes sp.]